MGPGRKVMKGGLWPHEGGSWGQPTVGSQSIGSSAGSRHQPPSHWETAEVKPSCGFLTIEIGRVHECVGVCVCVCVSQVGSPHWTSTRATLLSSVCIFL